MTGVNHHPADLPALVIEQEVLDGTDRRLPLQGILANR
jgi:hypothetical protein